MIIELGHIAALLAMALTVVGLITSVLGAKWDASFLRVAKASVYAVAILLVLSCLSLVYAFLKSDFSVLYVAMNSNLRLPVFYKVAALWGGHEGSLLFWAAMMSVFGALAVRAHWKSDPDFMPSVMGTFSALTFGFLALTLILSSPFERLFPVPLDGRDLNPLLQDVQMVFHPPALFAGYTGFAVPFAFALAVLMTGKGIDRWIFIARRWTLGAWIMLTVGVALGGHWAYRELGWGGYWAWDPVENASLMPWLIGTALIHSVMVQEQSRRFRIWSLSLAIMAFAFSILGTFLVRSGIISSVHAFASDPSRGLYLLMFFFAVLIFSFGLLIFRGERFKSEEGAAPLASRETFLLINNWVFLVLTFTVLLGTLFPLFMDLSLEKKLTVAAPFFNQVFVPIMVVNLIFMSIAPMVPWKKFSMERLRRIVVTPTIVAVVAMAILAAFGIHRLVPLFSLGVAAFGMVIIGTEWVKATRGRMRSQKLNAFSAFKRMASSNRRRFGGLLAHLGVLVMIIGFVGSYAYQTEVQVSLAHGETAQVGNFQFDYTHHKDVVGPNWKGQQGMVDVFQGPERNYLGTLTPQKREYARSDMPMTQVSRLKTLTQEVYIALGIINLPSGDASFKIYLNPFVQFVWAGIWLLFIGGLIGLSYRSRPPRSKA